MDYLYIFTYFALFFLATVSLTAAKTYDRRLSTLFTGLTRSGQTNQAKRLKSVKKDASRFLLRRPHSLYIVMLMAAINLVIVMAGFGLRGVLVQFDYILCGVLVAVSLAGVLLPFIMTAGTLYRSRLEYSAVRYAVKSLSVKVPSLQKGVRLIQQSSVRKLSFHTLLWMAISCLGWIATTAFVAYISATLSLS